MNYQIDYESRQPFLQKEYELQREVVKYLRQETDLVFVPGLIADLNTYESRRLHHEQGYTKGIPDILILTPSGCGEFNLLAIELKNPQGTGVLSNDQDMFLSRLVEDCRAYCLVSNSLSKVVSVVERYKAGTL